MALLRPSRRHDRIAQRVLRWSDRLRLSKTFAVQSFPHIADAAAVTAVRADQQYYAVRLSVTTGTRYAFGCVLANTDDGDTITFSRDDGGGFDTIEARVFDKDNLANLGSSYFEDGVVWESDYTGTVTIKAEVTSGTANIEGFVAREASSIGIVEDQGSATHCWPHATMYGGSMYSIHCEMYTGDVYLAIDGALEGLLFSRDSGEYNEHYHNGAAIKAISTGVVAFEVGHDQAQIRSRYMPSGSYASIGSVVDHGGASSSYTYMMVEEISDVLYILTRGDDSGAQDDAIVMKIENITTTPTTTIDVVISNGSDRYYPRAWVKDESGSTPVIFALWNERGGAIWERAVGAIYAPDEGTYGEWYSLNGVEATVQNALGTDASPRLDTTDVETAIASGGFMILDTNGANTRYIPPAALFECTQFPESGVTVAKGKCFFLFIDWAGGSTTYGSSTVRGCIQNEGTRSVSSSNFTLPGDIQTPNSYRVAAAMCVRGNGDYVMAITDRGTRTDTNLYSETTDLYYDWGSADDLEVFTITNPFTTSIAFTLHENIDLSSYDLAAGFLSVVDGDPDTITYQTGENELHPTHRQSTRVSLDVSAAATKVGAVKFGTSTEVGPYKYGTTTDVGIFAGAQ